MGCLSVSTEVARAAKALVEASRQHSGSLTLRASHLAAMLSGVSQGACDAVMSLMDPLDEEQREASAAGAQDGPMSLP